MYYVVEGYFTHERSFCHYLYSAHSPAWAFWCYIQEVLKGNWQSSLLFAIHVHRSDCGQPDTRPLRKRASFHHR